MKYLTAIMAALMFFVVGCQTTQSTQPPRGVLGGVVSSVTDNIAHAGEAQWGSFMFVGALFVLIGGIAWWIFQERGAGFGLILTGFGVGAAAVFLQEFLGAIALVALAASLVIGGWWVSSAARRKKLRKRAGKLFAQGRTQEALEVEREADPEIDKELRKVEKKNGH